MSSFVFYFYDSYDAYDKTSGVGRYANDEWKDPNCVMKKMVMDNGVPCLFLHTIKDVPAHTELRYDYGDSTAPWRR